MKWSSWGYAESATISQDCDSETVSLRCDITNFSLKNLPEGLDVGVKGFLINIRQYLGSQVRNEIRQHSSAYLCPTVSSCLLIENISRQAIEEPMEVLNNLTKLLSIACRGHCAIAARHIIDKRFGIISSTYKDPIFHIRGWSRPLIPNDAVEDFLVTTINESGLRIRRSDMPTILDHYFQALSRSSAWSLAIGVFTAMEALRSSFFAKNSSDLNDEYLYWVKDYEGFSRNDEMSKKIIKVLASFYPRFNALDSSERMSLNAQISKGLIRRSYKTQLRRMLELLDIDYRVDDLQLIIETRNRIIHSGSPLLTNSSRQEYSQDIEFAWENVKSAVSLFEQCLLGCLGYPGPRELFGTGFK
jgi:hypothetical protein